MAAKSLRKSGSYFKRLLTINLSRIIRLVGHHFRLGLFLPKPCSRDCNNQRLGSWFGTNNSRDKLRSTLVPFEPPSRTTFNSPSCTARRVTDVSSKASGFFSLTTYPTVLDVTTTTTKAKRITERVEPAVPKAVYWWVICKVFVWRQTMENKRRREKKTSHQAQITGVLLSVLDE